MICVLLKSLELDLVEVWKCRGCEDGGYSLVERGESKAKLVVVRKIRKLVIGVVC